MSLIYPTVHLICNTQKGKHRRMKAIKYAPGKYASPSNRWQPAASTSETSTSSSSASKNSLILYNKLETLTPFQPTTQLVPISAKCILTSRLMPMTIIPHHCYQHWLMITVRGAVTSKSIKQQKKFVSTWCTFQPIYFRTVDILSFTSNCEDTSNQVHPAQQSTTSPRSSHTCWH